MEPAPPLIYGNLIEFKAGRMIMVGKMVEPDGRKGLVFMRRNYEGDLHFCWKDRSTGIVELDVLVLADQLEFQRVDQCKTGRVYVLKFRQSTRRMFFWMQEAHHESDDAYCMRINELLSMPGGEHLSGGSDQPDYMLPNARSNSSLGLDDVPALTFMDNHATSPAAWIVDFAGAFRAHAAGAVAALLMSPARLDALIRLLPLESFSLHRALAVQIQENIESPQFYATLSQFSRAFQAGLLGPILERCDVSEAALVAAYAGDLAQFFRVLSACRRPARE